MPPKALQGGYGPLVFKSKLEEEIYMKLSKCDGASNPQDILVYLTEVIFANLRNPPKEGGSRMDQSYESDVERGLAVEKSSTSAILSDNSSDMMASRGSKVSRNKLNYAHGTIINSGTNNKETRCMRVVHCGNKPSRITNVRTASQPALNTTKSKITFANAQKIASLPNIDIKSVRMESRQSCRNKPTYTTKGNPPWKVTSVHARETPNTKQGTLRKKGKRRRRRKCSPTSKVAESSSCKNNRSKESVADNTNSLTLRPQNKKQSVPIQLKSNTVYHNGKLHVNVIGDFRGNPAKENFDVMIRVLHKRNKNDGSSSSRHAVAPSQKGRHLPACIDWDVVQHRAMLPRFNTQLTVTGPSKYLSRYQL